ncbi:cytochrome c oxidase subunit 3 [Methylobacterium sp. ID0610]|uniref:cytochrome c oxidase subunit 3 n=1 Tax=Methylobacterium carpenticola TaxID=3344827 RepID=UPI0036C335F1
MSLVLLYLAALAIVSARWLARQHLTAKPWLGAGPPAAVAGPERGPAPAMLGLAVFLAAVGLLFALLTASYGMRVPPGGRIALDPRLLWITTGALAVASVALHLASAAVRRGEPGEALGGLLLAGAGSLVFLGGQGLAWRRLWAAEAGRTADAAGSFFYLITVLHALHLAGGLVALARTTRRAARAEPPAPLGRSIALCTLYWDALLAIWLVVFGLLFRTPWSGLVDALCRPA